MATALPEILLSFLLTDRIPVLFGWNICYPGAPGNQVCPLQVTVAHATYGIYGEAAALLMEVPPYPLPLAPACNLDMTPGCTAFVGQP